MNRWIETALHVTFERAACINYEFSIRTRALSAMFYIFYGVLRGSWLFAIRYVNRATATSSTLTATGVGCARGWAMVPGN